MSDGKYSWEEIIGKYDAFEKKLAKDPSDETLPDFFNSFDERIINSGFDLDQLTIIRDRMKHLSALFSERKLELKRLSSEAITKSQQITQYTKNVHLKNRS